jgi:hypothetical protein
MTNEYAAGLSLEADSIDVLGHAMTITLIRAWEVSIRPCEFDNFARLLGMSTRARAGSAEYQYLMRGLTTGSGSLLDLVDMPDATYEATRAAGVSGMSQKPQIFPVLDKARKIVRSDVPGHNVVRYPLLRMNNQILKAQYSWEPCARLSGLNLQYGCIPFDQMPYCTSLRGHNPRYWDLVKSIDAANRTHELLVRRVKTNIERNGVLYTPVDQLSDLGDIDDLVASHNRSSTTSTPRAD